MTPALATVMQQCWPGARLFRRNGGSGKGVRGVGEKFEQHKQAWTSDEVAKLHALAKNGMPLRAIANALTRREESVKARAKGDRLDMASRRRPPGGKAVRLASAARRAPMAGLHLVEGLAWLTFLGASFLGLRVSLLDFAWPLAIVCLLNGLCRWRTMRPSALGVTFQSWNGGH